MNWKNITSVLHKKPWTYRLKIIYEPIVTDWSNWVITPTETYIEAEKQGPYQASQIEWIDINPIEIKVIGRIMPEKEINHSDQIIQLLEDHSIVYKIAGDVIRVFCVH